MIVQYEATIKFTIVHHVDSVEDVKSDREFAEDIAQMVCDEGITAGAVCSLYDIKESKINVTGMTDEETENKIYNDFMKKGYQ